MTATSALARCSGSLSLGAPLPKLRSNSRKTASLGPDGIPKRMPLARINASIVDCLVPGINSSMISTDVKSTNIMWHECPVRKPDRQKLLKQKGCVIWITGLSGSDAGVICIACLISPYRKDRVFMNVPLEVCEARDPKGLYKLARGGKIKGFTGIDDPYQPPVNCEVVIQHKDGECSSPNEMTQQIIQYLDEKGFLQA